MEAKVSMTQLKDIETMMSKLPTNDTIADWKKSFKMDFFKFGIQ